VVFVVEEVEEKLSLEADNKMFFFDIGENQYGDYLRISEVFLLQYINIGVTFLMYFLYIYGKTLLVYYHPYHL